MSMRDGGMAGLLLAVLAGGACARTSSAGLGPAAPAARVATRSASLPSLVATDSLADWIAREDLTVIDVRTDVFTYLKGHLPGAIYLNTETLRAAEGGVPTQLLPASWYAGLFSRLGLRKDRPVVIYSAGETHNFDATFLAWLLAGFGHPRVYVVDGGYFKWELEQRPVVQEYPAVVRSDFPTDPFAPDRASLAEVREALTRPTAALVDARAPDQYAGEAGAQIRRGHIPGAISHPWQGDLEQEGFGHVWRPREALRASYVSQGVTPDKDIIVYCNTGAEASHLEFALRYLLGYPHVRVYVGSWNEWSARPELPVVKGSPVAQR